MINQTLIKAISSRNYILIYSPNFKKNYKKIFNFFSGKAVYSSGVKTKKPELKFIEEIVSIIKKKNFDTIISIGGGKVIDSSKVIKYLLIKKK